MAKKHIVIFILAILSTPILASTCPTHFTQESSGHWISAEEPGWRSAETGSLQTDINSADFGGVLYSPKHKRMVCVFRTNKGFWVAMISNTEKRFQIDRHALDSSRKHLAWRWDRKHKDFSCGRPNVINIANCPFTTNA